MSTGWSLYVIILVVLNIVGCAWLLLANRKTKIGGGEGETMDHSYDGIEEYNNPLPAWWTWMFVITIVFSIIYLVRYPGFGNAAGALGWTSGNQYEAEMAEAEALYGPIFAGYYARTIPELQNEQRALDMGGRLFANNCATCHGSDARGGDGYPNLTDDDWLWGGAPETIIQSITMGRNGMMPQFAAAIGGEPGIKEVTQYVLSLSGRDHDAQLAAAGAPKFAAICAVCHQADGRGNPLMGAPNLTDDIWLHGGRPSDIEHTIRHGIANQMPAHGDILSQEKIHLLAAYVYSLSRTN